MLIVCATSISGNPNNLLTNAQRPSNRCDASNGRRVGGYADGQLEPDSAQLYPVAVVVGGSTVEALGRNSARDAEAFGDLDYARAGGFEASPRTITARCGGLFVGIGVLRRRSLRMGNPLIERSAARLTMWQRSSACTGPEM